MNMTICVPISDPESQFERYLDDLLKSIQYQTYLPDKILFSGNRQPDYLDSLILKYAKNLNIESVLNESTGASDNLNYAISKVETQITKIMFQDDFFIEKDALNIIIHKIEKTNNSWFISAFKNYDDVKQTFVRNFVPHYSHSLLNGKNSIGSPSGVTFKTSNYVEFDSKLKWMMDCDWYLSMRHHFGKPGVINQFLTANRLHSNQATHKFKSLHDQEVKYVQNKHIVKGRLNLKMRCSCLIDQEKINVH